MSEIRRALNALQKMIAKAGIENVPLGNEKLRPLLMVMRDVAERHPTGDRRYIGQETGEPAALEVGAAAMGRRKGEDTFAAKRRRMPFVAKIRREDAGWLVCRFTTWAKARAMQHWIDRSGIAHRPMAPLWKDS